MRSHVSLVLMAVLALAGIGCDKSITDNDIKYATLTDVKQIVDGNAKGQKLALLVDPRPPSVYAVSRLPGAVNLQLPGVNEETEQDPALLEYAELVVYGDNPASPPARAMTKRLLAAGYKRTRMFAGGLEEWSANYTPETGPPTQVLPPRRRMR